MTDEQAGHRSHIITLLSDFGLGDAYVAVMKGVILNIYRGVTLVDITHQVPAQQVRVGMERLGEAWPYFPKGTVHLAVVDPGVGSSRLPIVVEAGEQFFVGPDNGIFTEVLHAFPMARVHVLESPQFRLPKVSATFHGRDIFAPAAAWLARGLQPEYLGRRHDSPHLLPLTMPVKLEGGGLSGILTGADGFGNLLSTLTWSEDSDVGAWWVCFRSMQLPLHRIYSEVPTGELVALIGSTGKVELAVNGGSAQERLNAMPGEPIWIVPALSEMGA